MSKNRFAPHTYVYIAFLCQSILGGAAWLATTQLRSTSIEKKQYYTAHYSVGAFDTWTYVFASNENRRIVSSEQRQITKLKQKLNKAKIELEQMKHIHQMDEERIAKFNSHLDFNCMAKQQLRDENTNLRKQLAKTYEALAEQRLQDLQ